MSHSGLGGRTTPQNWPRQPLLGTFIVQRLLAANSRLRAQPFAGKTTLLLGGEFVLIVNPLTLYPGRRLRGFMEKAEVTPETWANGDRSR